MTSGRAVSSIVFESLLEDVRFRGGILPAIMMDQSPRCKARASPRLCRSSVAASLCEPSEIERNLRHRRRFTPLGVRGGALLLLRHEGRRGMRVENLERLDFLIRHRREREVRIFPLLRIMLDLHIHASQARPELEPL